MLTFTNEMIITPDLRKIFMPEQAQADTESEAEVEVEVEAESEAKEVKTDAKDKKFLDVSQEFLKLQMMSTET